MATTYTIAAGTVSSPIYVPQDGTITVSPASGATATVQYTRSSYADIRNNVASWKYWPGGNVKSAKSNTARFPMYVVVQSATAATTVTLDEVTTPTASANISDWYTDDASSYTLTDASTIPYPPMMNDGVVSAVHSDAQPLNRMAQFWEGIRRGACKVLLLGDSVTENVSQNYPTAHWTIAFENALRSAFPNVTFTFVNLSIGGRQARQVLGYGLTATVPTSTPGAEYPSVTSGENTLVNFLRTENTGDTATPNPITWGGPASGEATWGAGQTWVSRLPAHNFDLMTLCFGLNEENSADPATDPGTTSFFAQALQSIIDNVRSSSTWSGKSRPSIVMVTPYNDSVSRPKRDRLAQVTRDIAATNDIPLIDGHKWDGVLVEGLDKTRQRWFGEPFFRGLATSRSNGTLVLNSPLWWYAAGTPTNSGSQSFIAKSSSDTGTAALKLIRKRAARDFQIVARFTAPSSGSVSEAICSLWYRIDSTNHNIGYEVRYVGSGTLSILYNDGSTSYTVATKSIRAFGSNSETVHIWARCIGGRHQVWTTFGASPPATGGNAASLTKQIDVIDTGASASTPRDSQIYRPGYCGISIGSSGTAYPSITMINTSIKQTFMMEFGYPRPVNPSTYGFADLLGSVNDFIMQDTSTSSIAGTNYDSPGGGVINHMMTDAYDVVYSAAIKQFVNQLVGSRTDLVTAGSSGASATGTATTSEEILATIAIPKNALAKNGTLEVQSFWTTTSSANNKTVTFRLGTTGVSSTSLGSKVITTEASPAVMLSTSNRNGDASQASSVQFIGASTTTITMGTTAIDTSVDLNLYITSTKASAGETMTLERYSVRIIGG